MLMNGGVNAVEEIFDKYSSKPNVDSGTVKGYNTSRGDTDGLHFNGRVSESQGGSQENSTFSRREGETGRTWEEDEESFKRRASQDTEGTGQGRRILLENGDSHFAYTPAKSDNSEASRAVDLLKSIGIDAIYCEGDTESNKNGKTTVHSEAVTTPDGKVYVSSNSSLSSIHIAAHEAVHVNEIKQTEAYDSYKNVINDNILWGTEEYKIIASRINQGNYGGKYDINDISFANKFIRELTAYVNEFVTVDIDKATEIFSSMFKDWEAVVEASKQFNKDIGADFSESALLMPQNDSTDSSSDESLLTEPSVKKADSDPVRDSVFELSGRQSYTQEQLKVVAVARKFGRKVIFEDTTKTQGFKSDAYYDNDGNVHFDYNNVKPLEWLLKHELTHFGEGTEEYKNYVDLLRATKAYKKWLQKELRTNEESLGKLEGLMRDKIMAEREAVAPINPIEAQAEIIANFSATFAFAKDSRGIEALTADMNLKEHNAFIQFILDFISYLKKKLGGSNKTLTKELSVLEDRYLKMLTYKAQNPTAEKDSGNKYSLNENLKTQLDDWLSGNGQRNGTYNGEYFDLGTTPDILVKHGAPSTEIIMFEDVVTKITGGKHSISLEEISRLPAQLNDPILLFNGSIPNSFVALTELVDKNGNDVIVAVHINKRKGRTIINKIASLYSKSDDYGNNKIISYVNSQIQKGNLIDASIKKAPKWFTSRGLQLPKEVQTILGTNNNVPQKEPVVNNNSMQEAAKNSHENISEEKNNDNKYSLSIENKSHRSGISYQDEQHIQGTEGGISSANNSKIQYSIPTEADELLDRYESGEISRDEFMSEVEELYNRSVDTFGPIKRGEKAQEEINVPRRVEKDKKTHRFVRTIIESDALTDEMLDDVKADIILGNFSYKAISDEAAKKKADQYIKEGKGESVWDSAVNGSPVHISKETKKR